MLFGASIMIYATINLDVKLTKSRRVNPKEYI